MAKRVFSGIQPSGAIHIGNYFGAIKQWLDLESKYECIYSVANLHALTEPIDPRALRKNTRETALALLALGLNYKKTIFFIQSDISEHTELAWILNSVTPEGDLRRMTQFKDKSFQFKGSVSAGLLNYPILMAADILLYNTELVPVGEDQLQHLELTREIARRFNKRFGKFFKLPKALLNKQGAKIMSLVEPTKKMSKSKGPDHYLGIFESSKSIRNKIAKAVTDSGRGIRYDPENKPGISNLMNIYSLLTGKDFKRIEADFKDRGYADFKKEVAEVFVDYFKDAKKRLVALEKEKGKIEQILSLGADKAKKLAVKNIALIKKKSGISY